MITTGSPQIPVAIVADVDDSLREALRADARFALREADARNADEIVATASDCEVLVTRHHNRLRRAVLDRLPDVRVIAQATSGLDNIDAAAADERGIRIVSTPGANANAVAEYVFAQLLAISRTLPAYNDMVRGGGWSRADCAARHELRHYRLGIVGVGNVGSQVARLARLFGMETGGFDPYISDDVFSTLGITRHPTLASLLDATTALTLHVPFTPETAGMIGRAELERLGRGSIVINASRGEVLDLYALAELIESGHLSGGACDVFDPEPARITRAIPPQLLLSPHIAGCTAEAKKNAGLRLYTLICEALGLTPR